eukprot:scaffold18647_cov94-Skeletonema_dohrnii-CCMP3373.AAC.2
MSNVKCQTEWTLLGYLYFKSGLRNCIRLSNALSSDTTCSNLFPFHLFSTLIHSTFHVQISASADFCTIFDTYTCRTANDGDEGKE